MSVAFDFTDKVVLITGGATGIGRATAVEFAKAGAKVVVGDVDDRATETVQIITDAGGNATFVRTDVTDDDAVKNLVDTTVAQHATIDIAFNNAGVLPPTARCTNRPSRTGTAPCRSTPPASSWPCATKSR